MKKSFIIALLIVLFSVQEVGGGVYYPINETRLPIGIEDIVQVPVEVKPPAPVEPVREYINVELTAYDNCTACNGNYGEGMTTSGVITHHGTLAVPKEVPLGTLFYINGEEYVAEDRGSAIKIKDNGVWVFDVWFPSHEEAENFGRVHAKMYEENGVYFIEY